MNVHKELKVIAKILLADDKADYRYDPKHEHKPNSGGWSKTDKGWEKGKKQKQDKKSPSKNDSNDKQNDSKSNHNSEENKKLVLDYFKGKEIDSTVLKRTRVKLTKSIGNYIDNKIDKLNNEYKNNKSWNGNLDTNKIYTKVSVGNSETKVINKDFLDEIKVAISNLKQPAHNNSYDESWLNDIENERWPEIKKELIKEIEDIKNFNKVRVVDGINEMITNNYNKKIKENAEKPAEPKKALPNGKEVVKKIKENLNGGEDLLKDVKRMVEDIGEKKFKKIKETKMTSLANSFINNMEPADYDSTEIFKETKKYVKEMSLEEMESMFNEASGFSHSEKVESQSPIEEVQTTDAPASKGNSVVHEVKNLSTNLFKEVKNFKQDIGEKKGQGRKIKQLASDFVKNMNPANYATQDAFQNAKKHIMKMSLADFDAMLGAILEEDED